MRIALNTTIASKTRTGTGTYALNLAAALMQANSEHELVVFCSMDWVDWLAERRNGHPVAIHGVRPGSAARRIFWEQALFPQTLKRRGVDMLHALAFSAPVMGRLPTVVTVHDLAFRRYPATLPLYKRLYYEAVFTRSLRRACRIITISEAVRAEIIHTFDIPPEKVVAIPLGVDEVFLSPPSDERVAHVCRKFGIEPPFLLAVGTLEPRKNLLMLLRAFCDAKQRDPEFPHKLVLVGKQGWLRNREFSDLVRSSHEILLTGYVPQEELPALYAGAEIFLFPSLYEGFGLPLLEAFASGVPVLASDIPVHREVCGEAAVLIPPTQTDLWRDTILALTRDKWMREELRTRGAKRVRQFSWKKTAEKTLAVYGMDNGNGLN
ncbi:glycosyltransferase family 1 protein [Candidatus Parcubacteria bacterium]|nr:MAG: glycosyltransferase family 1 protein [Candidatus Parcubacteria bacterium]